MNTKEVGHKPIDPTKIAIARKWSLIEWETYKDRISFEQFKKQNSDLENLDSIIQSHRDQMAALEKVLQAFDIKPQVIEGETLTKDLLKPASLVIALGGDDHLKYVSHFIDEQPLLGVNSDYDKSEGALDYFLPETLAKFIPDLLGGRYKVELWPRLEAEIIKAGKTPFTVRQLAISEIYLGTWARISMSKYFLGNERYKNSGALIALPAGVGESSWFNSAGGNILENHKETARSEQIAWCLSTEVWKGRTLPDQKELQVIHPDSQFEFQYTHYYDGVVSIDPKEGSGRNYLLKRGDRVKVRFASKPLKVVRPR